MANTVIQLKNSGATGNVPVALAPGELAINYADGKLYYGNASNNVVLFDVVLFDIVLSSIGASILSIISINPFL